MNVADPHLMLAFEGTEVPRWLRKQLEESPPAGVSLFREWNMDSPQQVAELTADLQSASSSDLPLIIAVDQEGGQLLGLAGSTPFAGNMALGASGDPALAVEVAEAMGAELAAVGVNVSYSPVADVATRAENPGLGIRSFGDDPSQVADLTAAMVEGFGRAGVLPTLKHFPGMGEATVDPHYRLPVLDLGRERLETVELPPFRAGIRAGAKLLMVGHEVVPALTDSAEVPVCGSEKAIDGFVRGELGFDAIVITDALDMRALDQGPAQVVEIIAMMRSGTDLLLCMPDADLQERTRVAVERGHSRGVIPGPKLEESRARIERVRASLHLGEARPEIVASAQHLALADRLAAASITLVRDEQGLLPIQPDPDLRILALEPEPALVTLADTTTFYPPEMAAALGARHGNVDGLVYPHRPEVNDISAAIGQARDHDLVIVGTVSATPGQARMVEGLLATGKPVVTVALRTPYDLASYPTAGTHVCTYSGHRPTLDALTSALLGHAPFLGRLPVAIPGLYPRGHGMSV